MEDRACSKCGELFVPTQCERIAINLSRHFGLDGEEEE